jgi:hypothetical protein
MIFAQFWRRQMATVNWPWGILLCRFGDRPAAPQPPQYYVDLFTQNGTGGACDYWREVSCNNLDLTGSRVFGWFTMNHAASDVNQLRFPGERYKLVEWGIDAARANGVDLSPFRNVLVVHNDGVDHGAAGNGIIIVHANPTNWDIGFICHEMGHGFGLPHSFSANPDFEYGDGWDLMSFATTTYNFNARFKDTQGVATVGINARNVEALGAFPPGGVWTPSQPDFSMWVVLDPLNQSLIGNHGYLCAKISANSTMPARPSGSAYTVEFRRKAGWDQAIPQDAVLIHEIRNNGLSYLQPAMWSQFISGQEYVTPDPAVFIRVVNIDAASATATIRIWDLPEGCLRREDSKPHVYLIENGQKRHVTSPQALYALGRSWNDIRVIPDGALTNIPTGLPLGIMTVSATPYPTPLNQPVQVIVSAIDSGTQAQVAGDVKVNGRMVAATNTPFAYTFRLIRRRRRNPDGTWGVDFENPEGVVSAPGYSDAPIDFGFP